MQIQAYTCTYMHIHCIFWSMYVCVFICMYMHVLKLYMYVLKLYMPV